MNQVIFEGNKASEVSQELEVDQPNFPVKRSHIQVIQGSKPKTISIVKLANFKVQFYFGANSKMPSKLDFNWTVVLDNSVANAEIYIFIESGTKAQRFSSYRLIGASADDLFCMINYRRPNDKIGENIEGETKRFTKSFDLVEIKQRDFTDYGRFYKLLMDMGYTGLSASPKLGDWPTVQQMTQKLTMLCRYQTDEMRDSVNWRWTELDSKTIYKPSPPKQFDVELEDYHLLKLDFGFDSEKLSHVKVTMMRVDDNKVLFDTNIEVDNKPVAIDLRPFAAPDWWTIAERFLAQVEVSGETDGAGWKVKHTKHFVVQCIGFDTQSLAQLQRAPNKRERAATTFLDDSLSF